MPAPLPRPLRSVARRWQATSALCVLALAATLGLACDPPTTGGKDPLASLASSVSSEIFDITFWVQQQSARTDIWRKASAFCRFHAELPNCRTVRLATWWGTPPPPTPEAHQTAPVSRQSSTSPERSRP
jgi:hypothetical protein